MQLKHVNWTLLLTVGKSSAGNLRKLCQTVNAQALLWMQDVFRVRMYGVWCVCVCGVGVGVGVGVWGGCVCVCVCKGMKDVNDGE